MWPIRGLWKWRRCQNTLSSDGFNKWTRKYINYNKQLHNLNIIELLTKIENLFWQKSINTNLKVSLFHITLNLILGLGVIKVVISVNDYKQIRQRYLNGERRCRIANSMGISRKSTVKARMSFGSVKLSNVKYLYLPKMFLLSSLHASNKMRQKAWRGSDIQQDEFLIVSLKKRVSKVSFTPMDIAATANWPVLQSADAGHICQETS